jgi:two-component system, NtrC family, sensor kinase
MPASPPSIRKELQLSLAFIFAAALLVGVMGAQIVLPVLQDPAEGVLYLSVLLAADLVLLFGYVSYTLRKSFVKPVETLVEDVRRMTDGGAHRIGGMPSAELESIRVGVNALAERLRGDQQLLADNVRSLEQTNVELAEARGEVLRAARLASVGTLAAGIAHEVGNPLGAIIGYVDVARSRALKNGQDPAILDAVRDEAARIDRIIRGLLDYARPQESGLRAISAQATLARVRDLLSAQGKLDGVEHVWTMDPGLPALLVETGRFEQVLVNLLLNAVDAVKGRADARITVSAALAREIRPTLPIRREADPSGVDYRHRRRAAAVADREGGTTPFDAPQWVEVQIADNGPGIAPEDLERVFDPFFTTKPPGMGTGLGLSICARLVESMGGTIDVRNESSGGAVFVVRLPAGPLPSEQLPNGSTSRYEGVAP